MERTLPTEILDKIRALPGVKRVEIQLPEPVVVVRTIVEDLGWENCSPIYDVELEVMDTCPELHFDFVCEEE